MRRTTIKWLFMGGVLSAGLFFITSCQCDKDKLTANTWVLEQYGPATALKDVLSPDQVVPPGKPEILLTLSDSDNRFSGSDGCNLLSGRYTLGSRCGIRFDSIMSTLMFCPDSLVRQQAGAYNSILHNVNKFKVYPDKLKLKAPGDEWLLYRKQ